MQIRKYQNSGKLNEGEIHVNIDPVTVTPEPWQYALRDYNQYDHKQEVYEELRRRLSNTIKNPYEDEYTRASNEFEKLGNNYWPANAREIIDNMDKAMDNYYGWDPLNSEEGYYKLKEFHDNPNLYLTLDTYPWGPFLPHSAIYDDNGLMYKNDPINVGMSDKGYNLLWNNCSDATKKLLEHIKGIKMPEKWHGITTPAQVEDWVKNTFNTTNLNGIGYAPEDSIFIPLTITEYNRWHNYEKEKKNY